MEKLKDNKKQKQTSQKIASDKPVSITVCPKSFYDTDNYWYYYTEIRKE
jgi:hypothetical protein